MSTKTYRGSCKCKRVTFEADIDLATAGTGKCNCTSCFKRRSWSTQVKPEAFRALSGLEDLSGYKVGETRGFGGFCKSCGVTCFDWVPKAEWNDGERVSISVATLDDVDPRELIEAPVKYFDGKNDNWWSVPAETRHL